MLSAEPTRSPRRRILLILPAAAATAALLLVGCDASHRAERLDGDANVNEPVVDPEAGAHEPIVTAATFRSVDVPLPPGVPRERLLPVTGADASRTYDDMLADFAARNDTGAADAPASAAPSSEHHYEALRRFAHARIASGRGEHDRAAALLEEAARHDPASEQILRELAHEYLALQQQAAALNTYERLLALDPDDTEAAYMVGGALIDRGEFESGAALLARSRTAHSHADDPALMNLADFLLARAWFELGYLQASQQAARRALEVSQPFTAPTLFRGQLAAVLHRASNVLMIIGDANARLTHFDEAAEAYQAARHMRDADLSTLLPREIYVHLKRGDALAAEQVLLDLLPEQPQLLTQQHVELAAYLAGVLPDHHRLTEALKARHHAAPQDARAARAVAMLLPPGEAQDLLRGFIAANPDNTEATIDLLRAASDDNPARAIDLALSLAADHLQRLPTLAQRLVVSAERPTPLIDSAAQIHTPAARALEAHLWLALNGNARAWRRVEEALTIWPDSAQLMIARARAAAALNDPELAQRALDGLDRLDPEVLTGRQHLESRLAAVTAARETALDAEALSRVAPLMREHDADVLALRETAVTYAAVASREADPATRLTLAEEAARHALEALALDSGDDASHELLMELYNVGGPLADIGQYRQAFTRLSQDAPRSRLKARLAARQAVQQGHPQRAAALLRRLVESDPTDRDALDLLMAIWRQARMLDEAHAWLTAQRAARPGDPMLLGQQVSLALAENDPAEAEQILREVLDAEPSHLTAQQLLAHVLFTTNRTDEALAMLQDTWSDRPDTAHAALERAAAWMRTGHYDRALDLLEDKQAALIQLPLPYINSAFDLLAQLPADHPQHGVMACDLALRLIEHDPAASMSVYTVALTHLAESGSDAEIDRLVRTAAEQAVRSGASPESQVQQYRDLAQALIDAGHPDAAGRAMRARIARTDAENRQLRIAMSLMTFATDAASSDVQATLDLLHEMRADGALPDLADGAPENEVFADLVYEVSGIYSFVGDEAGAERLLMTVLSIHPDRGMALNDLGYRVLTGHRAPRRAEPWIESAFAQLPRNAAVLDTIAWLRYKQGRFQDDLDGAGAWTLIQASIERDDTQDGPQAEVVDHLGDIAWRRGDHDRAIEAWEDVVRRLSVEGRRERMAELYERVQVGNWGLVVVPGEAVYDRNFEALLESARAKLAAAEQGLEPPIAPTFAEMIAAERTE